MKSEYLDFPAELFSQLGTNDSLTRAVTFAHGVCDKQGADPFFCTMYQGNRYKTTAEQKEQAAKMYEINKANKIKSLGNRLVFVAMGMEYAERYPDDVCNHRIRTEIINPAGRHFFIEVGTWGAELMHIDHVIDLDQEKEYTEKANEYRERIYQAGGFGKIGKGDELFKEYQKWNSQPYYWFKKDHWQNLRIKYTKENVLQLVNNLFECNFSEMEVEYNYLSTDDYKSISPNF